MGNKYQKKMESKFAGAVIHDHFDGCANCIECGGDCELTGSDLLASWLVRGIFEGAVMAGRNYIFGLCESSLIHSGVDVSAFWKRARETDKRH